MSVVLRATWTMKGGEDEAVLEALRHLVRHSREEPGCRFYQPYRDPSEPRVIHIFEVYDDEEAVAAHTESEHFKQYALGEAVPRLQSRERELFQTIDV